MTIPASQADAWVFVDTGAYFALTFTGDENHQAARSIYAELATERRQLVTTNFVLAETHALLLNRLNRTIALRVLESIDQSSARIVRVTAADERLAREILRRYRDKDFSLTDATSFVVMERLGFRTAFAFDRHFAQYGLTLLPRPHQ
jgi:predicted nucleic acid-binding protein